MPKNKKINKIIKLTTISSMKKEISSMENKLRLGDYILNINGDVFCSYTKDWLEQKHKKTLERWAKELQKKHKVKGGQIKLQLEVYYKVNSIEKKIKLKPTERSKRKFVFRSKIKKRRINPLTLISRCITV